MKRLITLLMAFVSVVCIFDIEPAVWGLWELVARMTFFGIYAVAWVMSSVLVSFDASRQLETAWFGQRGFWLSSLLLNIYIFSFQLYVLLTDDSHVDMEFFIISRCALDALLVILSFILSYLALIHPNDFYLTGGILETEKAQLLSSPTRYIHRQIASFGARHSLGVPKTTNFITASITDCKAKLAQGLVRFRILVKSGENAHSVMRQYSDFHEIHCNFQRKFTKDQFPNLQLPELPVIASSRMSIDDKIQRLNAYLEGVLVPELMTEELLDFLGVEGKRRTELGQQHEAAMKALGVLESVPSVEEVEEVEEVRTEEFAHTVSKAIFLRVTIGKWGQSSLPDGHIDYTLEWSTSSQSGTAIKRYNEFYALHKRITSELTPCHLPSFPSKNYLANFTKQVNPTAVNIRKAALEEYLSIVCNDPVYLSSSVLDFLGVKMTLADLWSSHLPQFEYILQTPVTWEGEVDKDESQYTVYLMTFIRKNKQEQEDTMQWKVGRRFREFDKLHSELQNRVKSPLYAQYCSHLGQTPVTSFPALPHKSLVPVSTYVKIEQRRKALQGYMLELLKVPGIVDAYAFREFIQEPEPGKS